MNETIRNLATPDRKVQVGAGMGGLAAILVWGANTYVGADIPAEVGIGLSTFLTFVTQYFVPNP